MSKKLLSNELTIRKFISQRLTDSRNRAKKKGWDYNPLGGLTVLKGDMDKFYEFLQINE